MAVRICKDKGIEQHPSIVFKSKESNARRRGGASKWPKKDLTYSVVRYSRQLANSEVDFLQICLFSAFDQVDLMVAAAMKGWSDVTPLRWRQHSGKTDIRISWDS